MTKPTQYTLVKTEMLGGTCYIPKSDIVILPELKNLLKPLSKVEREQLKSNIKNDGRIREPITVTQVIFDGAPKYVIVDGHNRFEIKEELTDEGISLKGSSDFIKMNFESFDHIKDWMRANNVGRRNLTESEKAEYALELSRKFAGKRGGDVKSKGAKQKEQNAPHEKPQKAVEKVAEVMEINPHKAKRLVREGKAIETLKDAGEAEVVEAYDSKKITKAELLKKAENTKKLNGAIDALKRSGTAKAKTALNELKAGNLTDEKVIDIAEELKADGKVKRKKPKAKNITRSHEMAGEMRAILEGGQWLEGLIQNVYPSSSGKPYKTTLSSFFREVVIREENGKNTRKSKEAFDRYRVDFVAVCQPKNTVFRPWVIGIEIKLDEHDLRANYRKVKTYREYFDYFFLAVPDGLVNVAKGAQKENADIKGIGLISCGLMNDGVKDSRIIYTPPQYEVSEINARKMAHELLVKQMRYGGEE